VAHNLQQIVDTLAKRLGRGVLLNSPSMRLVVHSPSFGPVDDVRVSSILNRKPPPEAMNWVTAQGLTDATGPFRVPANPGIGMLARIGIPIQSRGALLGYLWLIDADESLTDDDLTLANDLVEAAAEDLYRERLFQELERGRERELLRDLLSEAPDVRAHAAEELVEGGLLAPASDVAALVLQPVYPDGREIDEGVRISLNLALDRLRHRLSPRHSLQLMRPDHGVFVVALKDTMMRARGIEMLAQELYDSLGEMLRENEVGIYIGIGGSQPLAGTVCSYREARQAVRIARIEPRFGQVVSWESLGVYRLLSQLPIEQLDVRAFHPGLLALLRSVDASVLVPTLEHYLDRGCDAQTTARELNLHRASLYYRLHKIEEIAGVNLHDGEDRLALHLGLKLARLARMHALEPAKSAPHEDLRLQQEAIQSLDRSAEGVSDSRLIDSLQV
jgi:hypothetical protein